MNITENGYSEIHRAVTRGLDANARLKDSGVEWLGQVPSHWQVRRLSSLARRPMKNGLGESAQEYREDWPRYIRITDIAGPRTLTSSKKASLPPEVANEAIVDTGDLLLAAVGATYGKSYLHDANAPRSCFAGYLVRFSPNDEALPAFMSYWTQSPNYWDQVRSGVVQSTIQNFSASKYKRLYVALPPLAEQVAITAYLDRRSVDIDAVIAGARRQMELAEEYRARLIANAVTGKVDVGE